MSKYYMLECFMPPEWTDMALLKAVYIKGMPSWRLGQVFPEPPPEPIQIQIRPGYPDNLKEFYYNDAIVMTKRLLEALKEAGVDNLDVYSCVITNKETGFQTEDYVAVNLIGLVAAVDLEKSNIVSASSDHLLDTDFDGLEIDESKTGDQLMFRLAENTSAIMLHEKVRDHLLSKGFDMLTFVEPAEWVG